MNDATRASIPTVQVTVISDAICPWCYIGKANLDAAIDSLAGDIDVTVDWKPFELNPDMPEGGMSRRDYRSAKFGSWARSQALDAQVEAAARQAGVEIHHERMQRTPNTFAAHRVIWLAGRHGAQQAVVDALFRAYFVEGQDIGQPEVLAALAERSGLASVPVLEFLQGEESISEVRDELAQVQRLDVSGVPTFIFAGRTALSGAQSLEVIRGAIVDVAGG
ncbi:Predicted dithiol-disulfide isomerase, DsbA family [Modicisalibacter muralis]|uniref:Predicted dithiol-disulfide isomerase, DsbA family n=1 Tax=Modicisalibacter muralis TaxID=119000 RepID=A0A1G9P3P6_9GAMM|nr:DsbA family oxidoreductase [Halomonas muralis]SDL93334.1 Predicted dithiol-disulfide isomerase, DsbA family [Halomonas muralis]